MADLKSFDPEALVDKVRNVAENCVTQIREQAAVIAAAADAVALKGNLMSQIRVLRVLEYTYDSVETMAEDMKKWSVQGTKTCPGVRVHLPPRVVIRAVSLPLDVLPNAPPSAEEK